MSVLIEHVRKELWSVWTAVQRLEGVLRRDESPDIRLYAELIVEPGDHEDEMNHYYRVTARKAYTESEAIREFIHTRIREELGVAVEVIFE